MAKGITFRHRANFNMALDSISKYRKSQRPIVHNIHLDDFDTTYDNAVTLTYKNSTLTLKLFGEIPEPGSEFVHNIVELLETPGIDEINVIINSYGGSFDTAVMLYNMLSLMSKVLLVKTYATGFVFSAATIIYMVGQERIAAPYTNFMIHSTRIDTGFDSSPNTYNFVLSHISTVNRMMRDIFGQYFNEQELDTVLSHGLDLYFDEVEAFERGIVQHIGLIVPDGYLFIPILGPFAQYEQVNLKQKQAADGDEND